ncbi:glycoside hydrolase family 97 protein [Chitinophaga sp. GCM10012297]|uniref:Glycoside hydrolase family 97 protein n=1 Tax=Chitinophaga chungangae TaxID=2821488 RepID=A0ABS3YC16_9BACT|nr:glycoside hydrolase family 97 protein [Chitinophaga chungangae]MBO9152205.1 glycoside hydrolase family 97 protein [Chitinophaga chungangae]
MNFKYILLTGSLLFLAIFHGKAGNTTPKSYTLASPNGQLRLRVVIDDSITYSISLKDQTVIAPSVISMTLENQVLGKSANIRKARQHTFRGRIKPLYGKEAVLDNTFNELLIDFRGHYAVAFRAYNEGLAYRFITHIADTIKVLTERADFNLPGVPQVIFPETDNFTSWEVPYKTYAEPALIPDGKKAITPTLFSYPESGVKVVIAESDLFDYPGMYVLKDNGKMTGLWSRYPLRTVMGSWGDFVSVVKDRSDFIARTYGERSFPWRVIIASGDDKTLLNNQLIYKLATPSKLSNTSWIKPGKAAWEWWHDALLPGAAIPSGMANRNTALYNYYVDFAAENHFEYLMIDAGWSDNYNLLKVNPKLDVRSVIRRAASKQVGVFLWCVASTLMKDLEGQLDFLKSLGAAGIKVDFIDRDDQQAIQWFEQIARAAAKRNLMVNFHGCSKPTGLQRTYPNIVNYEAVRGAECSKWDYSANPDHHLLIPFIRMLAGPMDYTPGSMRNSSRKTFKPVDPGLPSTQGTKCHELAMFVIFDQPLAMLCDSPVEYQKYPDVLKFLSAVPTVFDETKVLDARVGAYALMAKRYRNKWFIGAMTNWDERTLQLDFSFLPAGKTYVANLYTDAGSANASGYHYQAMEVTSQTKIKLPLAKGGGAVAYLNLE